jgi:hypothetical protein
VVAAVASSAGALLACSGSGAPAPNTPGPGAARAAPALTHDVAGKEDCVSCHVVGAKKPLGLAETHKGRDNSVCRGCHVAAATKSSG